MILGAAGLQAAAIKALVASVLVLLAFAFGTWTGRELATAEHDAQRTREVARQFERYQEQVAAGEATAEQLHASLQRLSQHHATVTGALRHATLLARAPDAHRAMPVCPAAAAPAPGAAASAAAAASAQQVPPGELADPAPPEPGTEDPGLRLTLAAVSLWNSALAGAHVPAGACSAADPTGPTCADAAPFGLADAWANHAENAARCAANAARHRALLEHLNKQLPSEPRR